MPITLVDDSLVQAHLDRIDRFSQSVQALGERLNALFASFHLTKDPPQVSRPEPPVAAKPDITADDINVDDILSGIDLGIDF